MCATQTGYKSTRGRNSQRTFPVHPYAAACAIDTRRRDKEREKARGGRFRGETKVTREISSTKIEQIIQPRTGSLAVSLRIVNRRCQEIRECFEARLLKHPSFGCGRGLSSASYNYEHARLYVFGHTYVERTYEYLRSINSQLFALMYSANYPSLCTS